MMNPHASPTDSLLAGAPTEIGSLLSIEWRQDRRLRTMAVSGALKSDDGGHLASGLIQLGNRGLVIDLTGLTTWEVDAVGSIVEVVRRLGKRSAGVVVSDPELAALLSSRLGNNLTVEITPTVADITPTVADITPTVA